MKRFAFLFLATLSAAALNQSSRAQNTTNNYTGSATGSLLTPGNWSLGHVPTVSEDAVFPAVAASGTRTLANGAVTLGSLDSLATGSGVTVEVALSNSTLTLGGPGNLGNGISGTAADLVYVAANTFNISSSGNSQVVLGQSGNFNIAGFADVSAVISDGGNGFGITKTGAGSLYLDKANTFTGGMTLSSGLLRLNNSAALGTGTFTINGGSLQGSTTITTNNAQIWAGDFSYFGISETLNLGTGPVTLTGNRTISIGTGFAGGATLTVGGVISDGGNGFSLSIAASVASSPFSLVLTGNNSYSGGTNISRGNVIISNIGNVGATGNLGTGATSIRPATLIYTGAGETTNKISTVSGSVNGGALDTTGATGGLILTSDVTITGGTFFFRGNTDGNAINGNISGVGKFGKNGTGTWTLAGTNNTYSGGTLITGGTLIVTAPGGLGSGDIRLNAASVTLTIQGPVGNYIADTANLSIGFTSDVINLNYAGTDAIGTLTVNGVQEPPGIYGSSASGAPNVLPELFGTGTLTVLNQIAVPEPSTYVLIALGASVCARCFRRKKSA